MNCQEAQKLLDAYADGELDLVNTLEIERHIQDCQACSRAYQNQGVLRRAFKTGLLYHEMPPNLRRRVQSALTKTEGIGLFSRLSTWRWQGAGVALAFAAIILLIVVPMVNNPSAEELLAQEIISSHVRSLMPGHLTDVVSTDQHTVKPWFEGKLDFSPQVPDLASKGFTLIGGRLDYAGNKPVAALVYQRRKHFINLYIWVSESSQSQSGKSWTRQGYNLVRWTTSDMMYWAVSNIGMPELKEFAEAVQHPS